MTEEIDNGPDRSEIESLSPSAAKPDSSTEPDPGYSEGRQHSNAENAPASSSEEVALAERAYALDFTVDVSRRYHAHRRRWFNGLHRFTVFIAMLGSSAAVGAIAAHQADIAQGFALVAALLAAADFAIGYSERANEHDKAYREFTEFAAEIDRCGQLTSEKLRIWDARLTELEKDEPTPIDALNIHFHNIEADARNQSEYRYRLTIPQRMFKTIFTFPPNNFDLESRD